jgi:hypothetical protein
MFMRIRPAAAWHVAALALALSGAAPAADLPKPTMTDAQMITSAESALPAKMRGSATVAVMENGKMRTLKSGTNGFTCIPDSPTTPGPDPMCMDRNGMEWVDAWTAHEAPPAGRVGVMYMLEGGTDASNTDPYATNPAPANHWIKTGPHVMIVGGDASFYDSYPRKADPDTSMPYIMWSGTPYQHLMLPVK